MATDQIKGGAVSVIKLILWVLSRVYGVIVALRKVFYKIGLRRRHRLPCPVISVGNLTVGGTGKTPLVELIARALKDENLRPVILTRGYMGEGGTARRYGSDEAEMLRNALADVPVLTGADRLENARTYLERNTADVFLLDDGFQHWRLSRDMDIVVIDTTNPWGNGHLLPRGILREPRRALSRAQMFVLTKTDLGGEHLEKIKGDLRLINPRAPIVETVHEPASAADGCSGGAVDLSSLRGQKVCALCSIGAPDSFARTLANLGADIGARFAFMDHHRYGRGDIERVVASCEGQNIATVVTTEKDAVKLKSFFNVFPDHIRVVFLKIKIVIVGGEDAFFERIRRLL